MQWVFCAIPKIPRGMLITHVKVPEFESRCCSWFQLLPVHTLKAAINGSNTWPSTVCVGDWSWVPGSFGLIQSWWLWACGRGGIEPVIGTFLSLSPSFCLSLCLSNKCLFKNKIHTDFSRLLWVHVCVDQRSTARRCWFGGKFLPLSPALVPASNEANVACLISLVEHRKEATWARRWESRKASASNQDNNPAAGKSHYWGEAVHTDQLSALYSIWCPR